MYSRVKGWSSYAPERRWRGVCSKNNWNMECILNMYHTPIFLDYSMIYKLKLLTKWWEYYNGQNDKMWLQISASCVFRTNIQFWNWFLSQNNLTKIGIRLFSYCKLKKILNHDVVLMQIITLFQQNNRNFRECIVMNTQDNITIWCNSTLWFIFIY